MDEQLKCKIEGLRSSGTARPVTIALNDHQTASGEVYIKAWSGPERRWRAAKGLLSSWGLAVLSIFIPIAHFVLVPLFLFAGIGIYVWRSRETSTVLGGFGKCPNCSADFEIIKTAERWPLRDICNHCNRHVLIS